MLAECHVQQTELKPFLAKAGPDYLISRAFEELEDVQNSGNAQEKDDKLKLTIQLLNMARYKIREATNNGQKAGDNPGNDAPKTGT